MKMTLITAAAAAILLSACAGHHHGPSAEAKLAPTKGHTTTGTAVFRQRGHDVEVTAHVAGLTPGAHGFHIHDKGDCSAPDASSAGPHFNPAGAPHGRAGAGAHHAGDMPNIKADAKGVAKIDQLVAGVTLAAGANGAAGRALVVHRDPDDYSSQPAGNAGPRFACGVIPAN